MRKNGTLQKYYAYGHQRDSGPVVTDHQSTGQKLDGTGLQYYNARYYDPTIGAFISPDTLVPRLLGTYKLLLASMLIARLAAARPNSQSHSRLFDRE